MHLGKAIDEVHRDVRPHLRWNSQGLEQPRWVRCRRLVPLARVARADVVLHQNAVTWEVEVLAETNKGLLYALMAGLVCQRHHLGT